MNQIPQRRPIAARETKAAKWLATWLVRRGVSPNAISVGSLIAGLSAGGALACTGLEWFQPAGFLAAALLVQIRLMCNMLDGVVAIEGKVTSPVGELYNELPDRFSDAAILIGAGYGAGGEPTLGYVAACLAILTAYVRALGNQAGAHQEFCGPMAKPQRMATITVAALYAGLTPGALQPGIGPEGRWSVLSWALAVIVIGEVATVYRRLRRITLTLRSRHS